MFAEIEDNALREIEIAVSRYRSGIRSRRNEQGPCHCEVSQELSHHTIGEHCADSCGGAGMPEPCGGCYDCMLAQWHYYQERQGNARFPR